MNDYTLVENIEVALYELKRLRDKFDVPDVSNVGRHFGRIKEYLENALEQVGSD